MTPADILDYCLEEIEGGRKTLADCVLQFPQVPDLEAQLRVAQHLRSYPAPNLRPMASRQIENRLRRQTMPARPRWMFSWKWASGILMVLVGLGMLFQAVVVSLPGDTLYQAKRLIETAQIRLTPPSSQAGQYIIFAERRLVEITRLAQIGNLHPQGLASLLADFNHSTEAALATVNRAALNQQVRLLNAILQTVEKETATLQSIQPGISSEALVVVQQALDRAEAHTTLAVDRLTALNVGGEVTASATPTATHTKKLTQAFTATYTPTAFATTPPHPTSTQTASNQFTPTPTPTVLPPSVTPTPFNVQPTFTTTPSGSGETPTPPGSSDCRAQNIHSPNYCTPTPSASTPTEAPPTEPPTSPTPCPTNASGKPKCHP